MVKRAPPISSMSPLAPVSELISTLAKLGTAGKPRIFAVPCASKSSPVYMRSTLNARGAHTVSVSRMMFPPEVFDEPDSFRVAAVRIILKKSTKLWARAVTSELLLVGPTVELITGHACQPSGFVLRASQARRPFRTKTHQRASLSHGARAGAVLTRLSPLTRHTL